MTVDLLGFAVALFAELSSENDDLIKQVVDRLERWTQFERLETMVATHRIKGSRKPGLLDGMEVLYRDFRRRRKVRDVTFRRN